MVKKASSKAYRPNKLPLTLEISVPPGPIDFQTNFLHQFHGEGKQVFVPEARQGFRFVAI